MGKLTEEKLDEVRDLLNDLVSAEDVVLNEGKILEISKALDKLICTYYKKSHI